MTPPQTLDHQAVPAILLTSPSPALLLGPDGRVRGVNPAFERFSGLKDEALAGKLPEFLMMKMAGASPTSLSDSLEGLTGPISGAGYLLNGAGDSLPVNLSVTPIAGGAQGWSGYLLQIASRFGAALPSALAGGAPRQTLVNLIQGASRRVTAPEVFAEMQPHLAGLFGQVWSALYMYDGDGFTLSAQQGFPEGLAARWQRLQLPGAAFLRSVYHWQRSAADLDPRAPFDQINLGSVLSIPLTQKDTQLGCLVLFHPGAGGLGANAKIMLESLADPLSANFARAKWFEEVKQSHREWAVTFDAMPDFILILEGAGRIVQLNAAAAAQFQKPATECIGRHLNELPAALLLPAARLLELCREEGEDLQEWKLESGEVLHVRHTAIEPDGEAPRRLLVTLRDVTRLVKLEDDLAHQRQMAEVGQLIAGVAHEVRNPLFSITATLENLRRALPEGAAGRRLLPLLEKQTGRLTQLMEDLLDYSRPTNMLLAAGDLHAVLSDAVGHTRRQAMNAGVEVVLRVTGRLPSVPLDHGRLVEAILNLIENGLQHTPAGGKVAIDAYALATGVRLSIRNSGTPIPAELHERIFEPFFTTRTGGTGLGLPIVKRIIEAHGGTIRVKDEGSSGTCFEIFLPSLVLRI